MNLNRIIKTFHGKEASMSFPTKDIIDTLPKLPDGKPDGDKLPRETVKNVCINALANYSVKDKKEIFYVNTTAQAILGAEGDQVELKEKIKKFLIDVLYAATVQEDDKGSASGMYFSWVIVQVLDELGVAEE